MHSLTRRWAAEPALACLQDMTYVKQLENYEKAVMEKRFEEMPESEKQRLLEEVERAKAEQAERVKQRQSQ